MPTKKSSYQAFLSDCWQEHLQERQMDAPTVVSTFAGCGGSSLGYSMAGFRELLAIDFNKHACEIFRKNFPDVPCWMRDITTVDGQDLLDFCHLQTGELDVLDGSPLCQGFSSVGQRIMSDTRNSLFREYARLLTDLRPKVFVMENVSGMVRGKMKLIFADIMRTLKGCGYQVSSRLMNAMYFNVPQSRQRLIFIGVRNDLGVIPSHPKAESQPISMKAAGLAIGAVRSDPHGQFTIQTVSDDRPVMTITKSNHHHLQALSSSGESRRLTIDEVKRLSSFPDPFQFTGNDSASWERIGNTVPPLFMRAIAKHIRGHILVRQ